jgi:hypothetical protein
VEATCRKSDVLAYFTNRSESEIVVDPKHVTVLRTSRAPAPKEKTLEEIMQHLAEVSASVRASMNQPQNVLAGHQ